MNADREPNRLPLRAGAMLLFAVAVVFIGLGWHSAATSGDNPEAALEGANQQSQTSQAPASSSVVVPTSKQVCVINAGNTGGLAREVTDQLKAQHFRTATPRNYTGGSFNENTIFYDDDTDKALADNINTALGGSYSVEQRPSSFTMCRNGIPVIAYDRVQ